MPKRAAIAHAGHSLLYGIMPECSLVFNHTVACTTSDSAYRVSMLLTDATSIFIVFLFVFSISICFFYFCLYLYL